MDYIVSARTDAGLRRKNNQDSLTVKTMNTAMGKMAFAVICDGMGGLSMGEVASATVLQKFVDWCHHELPKLCVSDNFAENLQCQWKRIIQEENEKILRYGKENGVHLGTTITAILLTEHQYYIVHVGDTRAYEISRIMSQLTEDQTLVSHEMAKGLLSPDAVRRDPRRNILLQCVGASDYVEPEMIVGATRKNAVYLLCSDGFRHETTEEEMLPFLCPDKMTDASGMGQALEYLIDQNKLRKEQDNISAILIRTY